MEIQPDFTFKSIFELFDLIQDKTKCLAYLTHLRWNGKISCPHCKHQIIYHLKSGYKCGNKKCHKKFNAFTNTPLHNSKIELKYWFVAIYFLTTGTYGISSHELARKLDIRQHTAWFILHRIREFLRDKENYYFSGVIQMDEAVIGGRNQFRHRDKKIPWVKGQSGADKTWVLGMVKSDERFSRLIVVPDRKGETIRKLIYRNVINPSIIVTDDYDGYKKLSYIFNHVVVKAKGNFHYKTDDGYTTNRIEGLWTHLKRAYKGVYHYMSSKHLQRYCDEVSFRYMYRKNDDFATFEKALSSIAGSMLNYNTLIGKNDGLIA